MKEATLLKVALTGAFIGLVALYFLSNLAQPIEYKPKIQSDIGEYVKAQGHITKINSRKEITIIEITQNLPLKIVLFKNISSDLKQGDEIEIIGKTGEYDGEIEIVANKIRKIN